jgi:hypothetical protein
MSGGRFEYIQYRLDDVADCIQREIDRSGLKMTKEEQEGYYDTDTYYEYPPEVIEKFKEAVSIIRKASIYMHRVDWLLSGDDGDDTFLERLKDDLDGTI